MRRTTKKKPKNHNFPSIIKTLGSLTFAVFLIAALAVILILSTSFESFYGTPFAQKIFYNAGWFDVFLGLLAVNILCSALSRFPYKKKHTGFLLTHAGILILLTGAFMFRLWGIEGQMTLYEGEKKNSILQNTYELIVHDPSHQVRRFDLATRPGQTKRLLYDLSDSSLKLYLHRVTSGALVKTEIDDLPSAPVNHAVKLTLKSQMAGQNETLWLIEKNPLDAGSNSITMGPARIELMEKPRQETKKEAPPNDSKSPMLRIYKKDTNLDLSIDLQNIPKGDIPIGKSGLKVANLLYYPDARVQHNKLVSISSQPKNPAVEFDVYDTKGASEHTVYFLLFPEFESLHGRDSKKSFDLKTELTAPSFSPEQKTGPSLLLFYSPDGHWSYASQSSKTKTEGDLEAGKTYATGWMDFSFRVEKLFDHAAVSEIVEEAENGAKGQIAAEISLVENGKTFFKNWVLENSPKTFEGPTGLVIIALRPKTATVPFSLELKDFRKIDYPGTQQALSYESDVTLHDPKENLSISKTIRMNKPLDYAGYRIFQSSYIQDNSGEASIFTVAKNPGIIFIYTGACVIFLGIFLVFFVPPFSSLIRED